VVLRWYYERQKKARALGKSFGVVQLSRGVDSLSPTVHNSTLHKSSKSGAGEFVVGRFDVTTIKEKNNGLLFQTLRCYIYRVLCN
jgi:hypothetical protein